jgi:hypothetical protein
MRLLSGADYEWAIQMHLPLNLGLEDTVKSITMYLKSFVGITSGLLIALLIAVPSTPLHAVEALHFETGDVYSRVDAYLLAQNEQRPAEVNPPASGTLLLPADNTTDNDAEKKCMTVCSSWGEECTYVNRGSGGTTRSCRRTCQQYTQECF